MSITPLSPEEIKAFRKEMGFRNQILFAEALGVSRRNVEEWEAGNAKPPVYLRLAFSAMRAGLEPWSMAVATAAQETQPRPEKPAKAAGEPDPYARFLADDDQPQQRQKAARPKPKEIGPKPKADKAKRAGTADEEITRAPVRARGFDPITGEPLK